MPEEEIEPREGEQQEEPRSPQLPAGPNGRRRYFTWRNAGISAGALALLLVLLAVFTVVIYRYGVFDNYVKAQFVAKMARIGIVFDADVFRVTVAPLELELKNATFNDRVSGEKLFFIRDAHLGLSVQDLYAWQLSRDLRIDTTDISGAEIWIKFDENGRSNYDNLTFVEEEPGRVNFRYESVRFTLKDSVVHFGDLSRNIAAEGNNVIFNLEPEDLSVPNEQRRYKLALFSNDSIFTYKDSTLQDIDIAAHGVADRNGADITDFKITTPIGEAVANGRLDDWASVKYNLDVKSTLDLTQASDIFPLGAPIRGVGNFKGNVSGEGESYRVSGRADSQAITAEGVYLKGVNIEATVAGTNSNYEANGTAVAELLTFQDFRVDFPKLVGNVRGTGTDFRWVGELQAIAARSPSLTLGRLFLSDAVAEVKDRELILSAGRGRVGELKAGKTTITDMSAGNLRLTRGEGVTNISAPSAQAASLSQGNLKLYGITGSTLRVTDTKNRTDVHLVNLRSQAAEIADARVRSLTASAFDYTDYLTSTETNLTNVRAESASLNGSTVAGFEAPSLSVKDSKAETIVYSDKVRLAKLQAGSAILGSLNIAGVRLTIRQGTVTGTSQDIDAGNVQLARSETFPQGGNLQAVQIRKPVFVLEPSGRYRATADMSIGGGMLGSIDLGSARADVEAGNDRVALNNFTAEIMEGQAVGNAVVSLNSGGQSRVSGEFKNLDVAKLLALQGGRVLPIEGSTTGSVDLTFNGTSFRNASGTVNADITANAGADENKVPVSGRVELAATNGLFDVRYAKLNSANSELSATGRFDLRDANSDLNVALTSTDATEVSRLITTLGFSPELEQQIVSNDVQLAGNLKFNGNITGNLSDPIIDGKASLDSISMRGRQLGSVTSDIYVSPAGLEIRNGKLTEADGGTMVFNVNSPRGGTNNTSIQATLTNIDAGNLIAALPLAEYLPQGFRDFNAQTSGTVNITGLPNNAVGGIDISSSQGNVAGQDFNAFRAKATFQGSLITLEDLQMNTPDGSLAAKGTYDRATTAFDLDITGKNVQVAGLRTLLPQNDSLPAITGLSDFTAKLTGQSDRSSTYNINFNGTARGVQVNEYAFGDVTFTGTTANQRLNASLTATIDGRPQVIAANVNFGDENLPFQLQTDLDQSPLEPYIAFFPQLRGQPIGGTATGHVEMSGNLSGIDATGKRVFSTANLTGAARFTALSLRFQDTPLVAAEPVSVRFNTSEIVVDNARFAGGGSNMTINGTIALAETGTNNFAIDGRVNLNLLNLVSRDTFFSGFADVAIRFVGPKSTARLTGTASVDNASVSTFVGNDRITLDRIKTNIIFTSNQAQIEQATGYLGGGRFVASGGALLSGLSLMQFRLDLTGNNVTVPLPSDFITTGDAQLQVAGRRENETQPLQIAVAGRVAAKRSLYSKDIELSNIIGSRRDASLSSGGPSTIAPLQFDLTIEGRDALIVRNNIADLTASVSLHLTGDADNPQVTGRITANSGTIFFRNDRYSVQRAVLEFPPDTAIDPIISLQAESEIAGYQIFVNLSGPLTDTEQLTAVVRSSPALPQADVVSLITTGNLSNTESGIPTLAQSGINTAAEILADAIINNPLRKATNKLFGLNVFEIDPIISGERLNPSARLTVGRQINNNLRVTYSTNLSQDQNQVLALEYRVSNKLSFVAQYEQRSLSNVTRNRDNFSFEIRLRRRF
jgi:translocation and assembly module TamB